MITVALLATLLCVAQPQIPPDTAKLDRFLDRLAEKSKAMGSLTVVKDGKVLYTRAIGYGRIEGTERDPLTAASRFRIGSITKMFTAAMVLQLVEREAEADRHARQVLPAGPERPDDHRRPPPGPPQRRPERPAGRAKREHAPDQ